MNAPLTAARSYLYVPADQPERLDRSVDRGADALIIDLEDSVAFAGKAAARAAAAGWLARHEQGGPQRWVRINADSAAEDLQAVACPALLGVVVPKVEPDLVAEVDTLLTEAERRLEMTPGSLLVIPLIETARGLLLAAELARTPRVVRLGIGEADLAADLGVLPGPDRVELTSLRLQVVVASAAARIGRPIAPTSTDFRDLDAFRASGQALLRLGFRGRTAVHPAQIPVIHEVFTPGADEVRTAAELVRRFDSAGGSVVTDEEGRMVDRAVVRGAREVLGRAQQS